MSGGGMMDLSIGVMVPAYNVAPHLAGVIARFPASLWDDIRSVWILDDGSTDTTAVVAAGLARDNERIVPLSLGHNRGYGEVVRRGLALCRENRCTHAVCLHGDGQYPPEEIPRCIDEMQRHRVDILQGSRIASGTALSGGMPLYKYVANRALTTIENMVFGLALTDYHSGFLCYSSHALQSMSFDRLSNSFDFDLEVIATARSLHLSIAELPIPTRYADEVSYLNPIGYGLRVLRVLVRYLTGRYRP